MFVLHSDLNNFYASVECMYNPDLRNKAVAVVGDADKRHGIVLAKNGIAKRYGVKTGDTIWQAKQKCEQELVCVTANMDRYAKISKMVKELYLSYSDRVESFGIDEAWIDISNKVSSFEQAKQLADKIRERVILEFGLTVSIGVSFNKIFAKLGSDMKKPNATTVITQQNFRQLVWPLPANELLFVGKSTDKKLRYMSIRTIGELATTSIDILKSVFGKNGLTLHCFANGQDKTEVKLWEDEDEVKSIGNSTTCPRDLKTDAEVRAVVYVMAESVAKRLRAKDLYARTVCLTIKTDDLQSSSVMHTVEKPMNLASDIGECAWRLFSHNWHKTIRAVGVRVTNLCEKPIQYNFFEDRQTIVKKENLEKVVDKLRDRYGYDIIKRGSVCVDEGMRSLNPESEKHKVMPKAYIKK